MKKIFLIIILLIIFIGCKSEQNKIVEIAKNGKYQWQRREALGKIYDKNILLDIVKTVKDNQIRISALSRIADQSVYLDLYKNWKDEDVRIAAVRLIKDKKLKKHIARNDENWKVRLAAIGSTLFDQEFLINIAQNDKSPHCRASALRKIKNLESLIETLKNDRDKYVREEFVKKLDKTKNQALLENYALHDKSINVRKAAVYRLEDQNTIAEIIRTDKNKFVRQMAIQKLDPLVWKNLLIDIARNDDSVNCRRIAVNKIDDQKVLTYIAKNDNYEYVRAAAVKRLTDPEILLNLIKTDKSKFIRSEAIENINFTDQKFLSYIAKNDKHHLVRRAAVKKLDPSKWEDLLIEISLNRNENWEIRRIAVTKINDQKVLSIIARKDRSNMVRREAVEKISNQKILKNLVKQEKYAMVRRVLVSKIKDKKIIEHIALNDNDEDVRMIAVYKIKNQRILKDIAINDHACRVRSTAAIRLEDQNILINIAKNDKDSEVRRIAVIKITDQNSLIEIARNDIDLSVRLSSIRRISDKKVLRSIAKNDKSFVIKEEIEKRIFNCTEKFFLKDDEINFIRDVEEKKINALTKKINVNEKKILNSTMFKILGILGEYISRFNWNTGKPKTDLIERFYPKEIIEANIFEGWIIQLEKETNRNFNYSKKIGKHGQITFNSKSLSKIINSYYKMNDRIASLDYKVFKNASTEEKASYIVGAYIRFGIKNKNLMNGANCSKKFVTIGKILSELKCRKINVFISQGMIPTSILLTFQPNEEIKNYLRIKVIKSIESIKNLSRIYKFRKYFSLH